MSHVSTVLYAAIRYSLGCEGLNEALGLLLLGYCTPDLIILKKN